MAIRGKLETVRSYIAKHRIIKRMSIEYSKKKRYPTSMFTDIMFKEKNL